MKFSIWLNEISEPKMPSGTRKRVFHTPGNTSKKKHEYKFITRQGNKVTLHFTDQGFDEYWVIFYVNDKVFTNSQERDPEILSGIMYLLRDRADRLRAKRLTFTAHKDETDLKVIRNLDINKYIPIAMDEIANFRKQVEDFQPQMIYSTSDVWKKLNKPVPPPRPNVDKQSLLNLLDSMLNDIRARNFDHLEKKLEEIKYGTHIGFDTNFSAKNPNFIKAVQDLISAVASHSALGYIRNNNRRKQVYEKLMNRHFADKWNIVISGDRFVLTRKSQSTTSDP